MPAKMPRRMITILFLLSIAAIALPNIRSMVPRIGVNLVKAMANVVPRYYSSELSIAVPGFDQYGPSVDAHFISPSGKETLRHGFYDDGFKVRFAPTETGTYSYYVTATDETNTFRSETRQFEVAESNSHGFVHVSTKDPHYLEFDDGTPFYPIGINAGWWLDGLEAYEMNAHNINLGRVWMSSWHLNIEPQPGVYSESAAAEFDNLLALVEEYDIYIQLVLLTFTDFSEMYTDHHWALNPYNAANGGPCETPADFFTNETVKTYIKNRFNYILDRWGDNHRIAVWEFWNEVNLVGNGVAGGPVNDTIVKAWQEDVAQVFRQNDTHHRPLTTSASGDVFWDQVFLSDANDIIQIHSYERPTPVDFAPQISKYIRNYENSSKPVVIGEYGQTFGDTVELLHSGLWSALASGSGYSSMYWYTNHFEMSEAMWDRYLYFERFVRDVPWPSLNIRKGTGNITGASNARVFSIQGDEFALAWLQQTTSKGTVSGAKITFSDLSSGAYTVYVYNDTDGTYLDQYYAPLLSGDLTVDLPDFAKHLAVKVTALGTATEPVARAGSAQTVELGKTVTFDASGSLPGWNGSQFMPISSYDWNFGDGETGTDMVIEHTYAKAGTYNVTLTVLDETGRSDTTLIAVSVGTGLLVFAWLFMGIGAAVIALSFALYFLRFRKRTEVKT